MASLTQKKNCANWIACYTDADGKQVQRSTKTSDKAKALIIATELETAARQVRQKHDLNSIFRDAINASARRIGEQPMGGDTVEQFLNEWLAGKANEGTRERYKNTVEQFLEHLGGKATGFLPNVTHKEAQSFIKKLQSENFAPNTVKIYVKALSSAFTLARKLNLTEANPFEKALAIKKINVTSSKRKEFSPEQVSKIIQAAQGEWKTVILFGYYTGARLEDCARMKWDNVNLTKNLIDYIETKRGKHLVMPFETQFAEHLNSIASTDSTSPYLTPELAKKECGGGSGLSIGFKKIMIAAGVDPQEIQGKGKRKFSEFSFHSLRHTSNSVMANGGVSQETRMKLIGHTSEQVNSDYTHLNLETLRGAAAKIPALKLSKIDGKS